MSSSTLELLGSGEATLRTRRLRDILASADEFDLEVFQADGTDPLTWVAAAGTSPFLGEKRTVIVRNLRRHEPAKDFRFSALPETAHLVLVADEEVGDEGKQRKLDANLTAWTKIVTASKGTVHKFEVNPKELREHLRTEANRQGKSLTPRAADLIVEMTGGSLSRAAEEIEKLAIFVGTEPELSESAIRSVVIPSREWNVWRLMDSVTAGNAGEALTQLRTLLGSGTKPEEAAYKTILPMLTRHLRLVWQARCCIEAKCEPTQPSDRMRRVFPEQYSLEKSGEFVVRGAMKTARGTNLDQLTRAFAALSDADSRLKGMLPGFSATDTLELLALEMIDIFRTARV